MWEEEGKEREEEEKRGNGGETERERRERNKETQKEMVRYREIVGAEVKEIKQGDIGNL